MKSAPTEWPTSQQLWQRTVRSLGGGVSTGLRASMQPHPIFFDRGEGSRLWDVDGNCYLDYVLAWGPTILGHSHPALTAAVAEQLARGHAYGSGHRLEYQVAEQIVATTGAERVLFSNTGSEAVQVALRLARAHTERRRFVKCAGSYHGWADPALISYRTFGADGSPSLESRGQNPAVLDDVVVVDFNDLDAMQRVLSDPDNDVAAVLLEPVQCNTGVIPPAAGYLSAVRELCDRTGTLLVFDEVITGYRIAYGGAAERYQVQPDIAVYAKAIAGGFPLSAVAGRADIIDTVMHGTVHAGTYNGNPIVLAAAAATLEELAKPDVYERFESLTSQLVSGVAESLQRTGVRGAVRHVGPVVQIALGIDEINDHREALAADHTLWNRLTVAMLRRGVFLLPGGRLYLSTAHTIDDIQQTVAAFDAALAELPGIDGGR